MYSKVHFWFCTSLILLFQHNVNGYRKYYVEDECMPSNKKQKVTMHLLATGLDSVGEIRSNRFGTYSRTERNCALKLSPPNGYGIILTILQIDFRNRENCRDFIKILTNDDDEEKLCGFQELGLSNQTYFSDGDIRIIYHTSAGGMGFNKGIRLIFTVSKLEEECSSPSDFKCSNSRCIWAGVTCDGINNCGDFSDERFSDYPNCRTYEQISKNLFSLLEEITPVAITAVILAIISFIIIVAAMCLCFCRPQPEKAEKPYLIRDFPNTPIGGYAPLPGYSYGSTGYTSRTLFPDYFRTYNPQCVSMFNPHGYSRLNDPLAPQKIAIRYEKPPPYHA